MKKKFNPCNSILLNQFFDQELDPETSAQVSEHLYHCPSCQQTIQEYESVSNVLKTGMDNVLSDIHFHQIETRVFNQLQRKRMPWWIRFKDLLTIRKLLVPALTAAMLVFVFALIQPSAPTLGPSAIVTSFSGDVSSVMIIETPRSHQTVIWLNESGRG